MMTEIVQQMCSWMCTIASIGSGSTTMSPNLISLKAWLWWLCQKRIFKCRKVYQWVGHGISLRDWCSCYLILQEIVSLDILEMWQGQGMRTISKPRSQEKVCFAKLKPFHKIRVHKTTWLGVSLLCLVWVRESWHFFFKCVKCMFEFPLISVR